MKKIISLISLVFLISLVYATTYSANFNGMVPINISVGEQLNISLSIVETEFNWSSFTYQYSSFFECYSWNLTNQTNSFFFETIVPNQTGEYFFRVETFEDSNCNDTSHNNMWTYGHVIFVDNLTIVINETNITAPINDTNVTVPINNTNITIPDSGGSSGSSGGSGGSSTKKPCISNWTCNNWTNCTPGNYQTRGCTYTNYSCKPKEVKPSEYKTCVYVNPIIEKPKENKSIFINETVTDLIIEDITKTQDSLNKIVLYSLILIAIVIIGFYFLLRSKSEENENIDINNGT